MNFSSAVKVGGFAAEDIETVTDPIVHEFDMTDRGIQQEVPEHYIDSEGNFGTQIRKHIMAGLKSFDKKGVELEVLYNLHGKSKTPDQIFNLYNDIITENILENFRHLEKELYIIKKDKDGNIVSKTVNVQKVKDILLDEIQSRNKGLEYEKAIELVTRNGKLDFALPLSHPSHARSVESLLNAIFKNRITKQKINGGSFVQVSNFGFTDKLKVKINTETGSLEYLEVMLPWWSKDKFERYMTNGEVDIAKIEAEEPELLKGIGYRIPTEDKYSMVPLKIVGFLPQEAGGTVMLPAEITTIAGSDFDIDKLYIMLKQYEKVTDLSIHPTDNKVLEEEYQVYKETIIIEKNIQNWDENRGRITFASNKDLYWDGEQQKFFYKKTIKTAEGKEIENPNTKRIKVSNYNETRPASQNNRAQRDNEVIDIMFSVLTNPNTLRDFINPGGYSTLSTTGERLKKVYENKKERDFMSAQTQNEFAIANMVGKSLVGVAANHTANYSIRLHTNLNLKSAVKFDNKPQFSIHGQLDYKGNSIGKNLAEFLAAIVDNAKDPVAAAIFYNGYTADIISLMVSSGVPLETAIAFINQPILREFITEVNKTDLGKQKNLLKEFAKKYGLDITKAEASNITTSELWDVIEEGTMRDGVLVELDEKTKKSIQQRVITSFLQYKRQAEDLGTFIRATRGDTTGGAAGPTIADTERKLGFFEKALEMNEITGIDEVFPTKAIKGTNRLELDPSKSNVKWLATFIQYGLVESDKFLENFFPYSKPGFKAIRDEVELFKGSPLTVREINLLNSHIMSYSLSGHSFYNMTKEEREKFIYEFPSEFAAMKKSAEYGQYLTKENGITMRLKLEKKNVKIGKDFQNIDYDNTNSFSNNQVEDIKTDFLDLFRSEDPKLKKLGLDLVRYAFIVSGFNFGPNSFFQMIPTEFYTEILPSLNGQDLNGYIDNIMQETEAIDIYKKEFLNQFYRNMWKRSAFVPLVDVTELGTPKDFDVEVAKDGTVALRFKIVNETRSNLDKYQEGKKGEAKKMKPFLLAKITYNDQAKKKVTRDILVIWNQKTQAYIETHKLGVPNYVLEYSKNDISLSSAVKSNSTDKIVPVKGVAITPIAAKTIPKVSSESGTTDVSSLMPKKEVEDSTKGRTVEIVKDDNSNFKVTVMQDGRVFNVNTKKALDPVKDIRLINKAKLKSGYYQFTKVKADNSVDYAVVQHEIEGTKVISLAPSNLGGEITLTSKIAQEVLSKAPTREQALAKQIADKNLTDNLDKTKEMYYLAEEEARKLAENQDPRIVDESEENEKFCK